MAVLKIAGVDVAPPSEIKVGRFQLTKAQRTASGRMAMEIVAIKRRVDVTWQMIRASDLSAIVDLIEQNAPFFSLTYPDPQKGETHTITVYAGDVNANAWHTVGGERWWQDASIAFIEQ